MRWGPILLVAACGSSDPPCDVDTNFGCPAELSCSTVSGRDQPACVTPVVVRGKITNSATGAAIEGARVVAVGEDGAPLAAAAETIFDGSYEIRVVGARDSAEKPLSKPIRLHAAAPGYGNFPDVWRDWPSTDLVGARLTQEMDKYVLASTTTDVKLIAFAGGPGRGVIRGRVDRPPNGVAVTVVAESDQSIGGRPRGVSAIADRDGGYALFGLPPAQLRVRAYAKGASYGQRMIGLNTGEETTLDLELDGTPAAVVSGAVEIASGAPAQVSLVVASTWDPASSAGDEPAGLRASVGAGGSYSIGGVSAGQYLLVSRDADGFVPIDEPPAVEVSGAAVTVAGRLRLVPALTVLAPGANGPEGVRQAPELSWQDHGAEASYRLEVWNAIGLRVFERDLPAATAPPEVGYDGPLIVGQTYRFQARALDPQGALLTRTEDRRGVFYLVP